MNWGNFVITIITFFLVAFAVFLLIKNINKARKQEEEEPSAEEKLLTEIRDLLARS